VLADAVVFPNQLVITATPGADQKAWKPDSKGPRTNCAIPLHGSAFSRYLLDCYSPFGWLLRISLRSANFASLPVLTQGSQGPQTVAPDQALTAAQILCIGQVPSMISQLKNQSATIIGSAAGRMNIPA
jgi:hypothetical protein